jgi:predicted transposase/invertase (TIGR01784 family)
MENKLVCRPGLDVVFKKLFTDNTDLLKDFLSLALGMEISELTFLNTELLPEAFDEKFSRMDILLKTAAGTKINVELQNADKNNFKERSVFYCSKLFGMNFNAGSNYYDIPKTVCVNILQFKMFDSENYRSTVFPIIRETGEIITHKWEILYFETPKLPADISNRMELWLKFFTVDTEEALLDMERTNDTAILKASMAVKKMNSDERMREVARMRDDAKANEYFAMIAARRDERMDIARSLIGMDMSDDDVAHVTKLPISEIKILRANAD